MPIEIEAKMKLADPPAMARRLAGLGATHHGDFFETNIFFDTKQGTLRAADQGLRLRVSRNVNTGQSRCIITHKGPNAQGPLKSRQETELTVADADDAQRLLECLGFLRGLKFQKRRSSWTFQDCHIELDEVPHLGHFLEIEGPGEERIMQVRQTLGLGECPLVKSTYIALLTAHLRQAGQPTNSIEFPSP